MDGVLDRLDLLVRGFVGFCSGFGLDGHGVSSSGILLDINLVFDFGVRGLVLNLGPSLCSSTSTL